MKYIAFTILLVFVFLSYNQWIKYYVKTYNKKAIKCFIEGFIVSMILAVGWSYLTHFSNLAISAVIGVSGTWILSSIWETLIDKSPDRYDTMMRLLTASIPFIAAFLIGILST